MSTARSSSATAPSGAADRRGRRLARRNRFAGAGLLAILIVVTTFAMWSFRAINSAVTDAAAASALSDTYGHAATAVSAEESLERKYQVESNLGVRSSFDTAAVDLAAALADIQEVGNDQDRALVATVTIAHARYLDAVDRLFAAVDAGDTELSRQIDRQQSDPTFDVMEAIVLAAAGDHHEQSLRALAHLRDLEAASQRLTPIVLLTGVILAAVLAAITRGHRRTLDVIRTTAIHDSLHDALTGLPNRTLLAERCTHALATDAIAGTSTGLLLIDLDRFKEINDTFGHHYGDELLTQVGPRLAGAVRNGDTVARLGGDEFAVLLTDVRSEARAREVAGEMRAALDSPFHVEGVDLDVDASIGVAVSGVHGDDASTLLQHADIAMYIAKARNCGVFSYDPSVDGHTPAKLSLLGDLRRALERHELILHYQPKISLSTGDVVGVEALVRWQHPEHGLIMPDDFIPLAEHTGLIGPLTRDILVAALTQARAWFDSGRPVPVAVNLSARNLVDEHLPDEISKLLTARGVPADLLELEVTESALMTEPLRAQRLLRKLSALGIRISIDDFGAGYTSLGQLRNLPITELKIDRSFVTAMTTDRSSALIVHSVIDLGHNLGLTIVAEGVETAEAMRALAAIGCDVAQGYHVSPPISADALDVWCRARTATPMPGRLSTLPDHPAPGMGAHP